MNLDFGGKKLITGIGASLIDVLLFEDDKFVNSISDIKGGMTLVDNDFINKALSMTKNKLTIVPGGATCNTLIGIGRLGGTSKFAGKRGDDEMGSLFENDIEKNMVSPKMIVSTDDPTGRVLSVITPDAQRSMFTYLGAAASLGPHDVDENLFDGTAIAIVEAYLLFNDPSPTISALKSAKKSGAHIAIDLSSFTVVEVFKDLLENEIMSYVDILIANEDEAKAFTGHTDEAKAIEALSKYAKIAVLKVGKKGSYIACGGKVTKIEPKGSGDAVDTTGAGDLWAAGFLYGLVNGLSIEKSGEIASACGFEVCQVVGANIPDEGWNRIKNIL
jgi:sugar/nucleoside kinase (ribokinase family)